MAVIVSRSVSGAQASASVGAVSSAPLATGWVHATDPYPGQTAGDLTGVFCMPNGDVYCARPSGLSISTDKGTTWTDVTGILPSASIGGMGLNDLGELMIGDGVDNTSNGINVGAWRLTGGSYVQASPNITAQKQICEFVTANNGDVIAVTAWNGDVWRSTNHGAGFTKIQTALGGGGALWTIAKAANGDLWTGGEETGGIYQSTDNGATWTNRGLSAPPYTGNLICIGFNANGEVLAGRNVQSTGSNCQRLVSGSWVQSDTGITAFNVLRRILLNPRTGTVYAVDRNGNNGKVYKSTDNGANWSVWNTGLPTTTGGTTATPTLAIHPDGTLFTCTLFGEFYRTNGYAP